MIILTLDAAGADTALAIVGPDGTVLHQATAPTRAGLIETLPGLLRAAVAAHRPDLVAVITGPGSFTGLRTSLALAQGYADAAGVPVTGLPIAAAFAAAFAAALPDAARALWVVLRARPGRVYLLRDAEKAAAMADADLPAPATPIMLAGDAAGEAAAILAARGANVLLTSARQPHPAWIAAAARAQTAPTPLTPLYIDPPQARPGARRPAPA